VTDDVRERSAGAVLRDARWTDVAALAALEAQAFPRDAWSERSWWAELAGRPRRDYVVALDARPDAVVADAGAEAADDGPARGLLGYAGLDHAGEVADVMTVVVAPAARGRGLGRALLGELEGRAAARGARHLLLEVRADHQAAIGLYQSAGFATVSTRRRYYQPEGVDALVMRKSLGKKGVDHG
jgi:ribosomal-protein-alanine N-acetyltransferase